MSDSSAEQHVQFRPYWACWIAVTVAVVLLGVSVFAAFRLGDSDTGTSFAVSDQIAMGALGIVLAAVALTPILPRVRADAAGVSVRNVLFSRRFDWHEIRGVSFPDGASFPRLELADDEYYSVLAVQVLDRERAVHAVRTLRRLHRVAVSAEPAGDSTGDEGASTGQGNAAAAGETAGDAATDDSVAVTEQTETSGHRGDDDQ